MAVRKQIEGQTQRAIFGLFRRYGCAFRDSWGGQVPDIGRELKGEGEAEGNALLGDTAALDLTREGLGCEGFAEEVGRGG